jgi:bifunctional UDP-N-acetylglucosamine pyrophosphorylase/glucosamine-1-phosphate N-acetyltransferase
MKTALIILAAGKGSRMLSDLPKVLHPIGGVPMLDHVLATSRVLEPEHIVVITGHEAEQVEAHLATLPYETTTVRQSEQLGTAHAVAQAKEALAGFDGLALVLFGDTPFISAQTLETMAEAAQTNDVVILGFEPEDPSRYGRLVMQNGSLQRIVEYKDASEKERAITLCNGGLTAVPSQLLFSLIEQIGNDNASGEYYLTDIVALARAQGHSATSVVCCEEETIGINTRAQLAQADGYFQTKMRQEAMEAGITLMAPETVYFAHDTVIGRDAVIEPNVVFGPGVTVESGARIRAFSHLEGCHVSRGATVGPYARLRPGAELSENVHIGNFVEVKNAQVSEGAKINHLSYIGDACVGAGTNIGAGTITCNYDGVMKHKTVIEEGVFIGSNTMLVAPVTVGAGALTATGSVITKNVPSDAIASSRVEQTNREGKAQKFFNMLRAKKARLKKDK